MLLCYCAILLFPCFDNSRAPWWFALLDSGSSDIPLIGQLSLAGLPVTWFIHGCHESWLSNINGKSTGPWRSRRWRHREHLDLIYGPPHIEVWNSCIDGNIAGAVGDISSNISRRSRESPYNSPPSSWPNNNKAIWYSMVPGNSMKRCCCSDSLIIKHTWQVVRQILCPWSWKKVSMWMISLENPTPWS